MKEILVVSRQTITCLGLVNEHEISDHSHSMEEEAEYF